MYLWDMQFCQINAHRAWVRATQLNLDKFSDIQYKKREKASDFYISESLKEYGFAKLRLDCAWLGC